MELNYNIGSSASAIAHDKQRISTMSIGGLATITSLRGYRDLNLINNMPRYGYSATQKESGYIGDAIGTLYNVPAENAKMSHNGIKGTLDNVGWLGGYIDMMEYCESALNRNGSETFQKESFITKTIGDAGAKRGDKYENTPGNARLGIDTDKARAFLSKYGILEYTNRYVEGYHGFNMLDGYKVLNDEYNFDGFNAQREYQNKLLGRDYGYGETYSVPETFSRSILQQRNILGLKDYTLAMGYPDVMGILIKNRAWESVNEEIERISNRSAMGDLLEPYDKSDSFADALAAGDTGTLRTLRDLGLQGVSMGDWESSFSVSQMNSPYGIDVVSTSWEYSPIANRFKNLQSFNDVLTFVKRATGGISTTINSIQKLPYEEAGKTSSAGSTVNSESLYRGGEVQFYHDTSNSDMINRTAGLFQNGTIQSIVSRFHTTDVETSDIQSAVHPEHGMSRGRNLLAKKSSAHNGYDDPYCRVWTVHHQYASMKDRIRPFIKDDSFMKLGEFQQSLGKKMRPGDGGKRLGENSVLMDNGFLKIAPTHNSNGSYNDDIKNYMFSIENLAWRDTKISKNLSPEQRGPNGGRIMWFPPYGLSFSDYSTVNWNPNEFIGRGEKIYTYTNTDRVGNLSFILLVDHPSILNKYRGTSTLDDSTKVQAEEDILRFFAGCDTLDGTLSGTKESTTNTPESTLSKEEQYAGAEDVVYTYVMFFPNDFSGYDNISAIKTDLKKYEYANGAEWGDKRDNKLENEQFVNTDNYNNTNSSCLFNNFSNSACENKIKNILGIESTDKLMPFSALIDDNDKVLKQYESESSNYEIKYIDIVGHASSHGKSSVNNDYLIPHRAGAMKSLIEEHFGHGHTIFLNRQSESKESFYDGVIQVNDLDKNKPDVNTDEAKIARSAVARVVLRMKKNVVPSDVKTIPVSTKLGNTTPLDDYVRADAMSKLSTPQAVGLDRRVIAASTGDTTQNYAYDNEYLYFKNLEKTDKLNYDKIVDKVQYFRPAYHSITPEGFNARLTFLQQCARQGSTESLSEGGSAGNLAFGRAPYCILRIGDFYHTKIVINNVNIQFDNNGGVSWDMNPEGIGVQPMYAKVDLAFNFIGGQDLSGPIERLQNAVSYNYYANTSVYDRHSDYNVKANFTTNNGGARTNSEEWRFNAMEGIRKQVK